MDLGGRFCASQSGSAFGGRLRESSLEGIKRRARRWEKIITCGRARPGAKENAYHTVLLNSGRV